MTARVLTPPPTATFGVISDVDDTILRSYITSVVKMALEMLLKNAYSRVTFPGVPAFYRALHAGSGSSDSDSTGDNNPIFYVSLSPWNLYSLLSQFLEINDIPSGPLILRDYSLQTLTSLGGPSPKRKLIQDLLDMYPELPFVLLGDSGQHDPEIYAEVVRENPGRIRAIYIRDVSGGTDDDRAQEVAALAARDASLRRRHAALPPHPRLCHPRRRPRPDPAPRGRRSRSGRRGASGRRPTRGARSGETSILAAQDRDAPPPASLAPPITPNKKEGALTGAPLLNSYRRLRTAAYLSPRISMNMRAWRIHEP